MLRALPTRALSLALVGLLGASSGCRRESPSESPDGHHYDDKQAALATFEEPERDAWAKPAEVIELLAIEARWDVADLGAGSGYFTRRLATAASQGTTYAIDVDADFKGHIEDHREQWGTPNIVTRLAVYEHPLLPEASVDLVFISNTYSFLSDREAYFSHVHAALREGGRLAVIDWRLDVECPRGIGCPKPGQRVGREATEDELTAVGFRVLERHDFLHYQYFLILGRAEDEQPVAPAQPPPETETPSESPPP